MAREAIELLDYVGWTEENEVHVVRSLLILVEGRAVLTLAVGRSVHGRDDCAQDGGLCAFEDRFSTFGSDRRRARDPSKAPSGSSGF